MNIKKQKIINDTIEYIKEYFKNDSSGHDYYHTIRVYNMALSIAKEEQADEFIVAIASLLHDVDDVKLVGENGNNALQYLKSLPIDSNIISFIMYIIDNQSYRKSIKRKQELDNIEARIVQDADRLDAMGAIGIARTFVYSGSCGRELYNPNRNPNIYKDEKEYVKNYSTAINHFYEKLLKLKNLMNTETAKKIAIHRHEFMLKYLEEFYDEWNGKK